LAKPQKNLQGSVGEIIENPILSNFKEGLDVLEYFISTHGARKGLADTALKTADAGYLTRRLHDVAQDLVVNEMDCGTLRGILVSALKENEEVVEPLSDRVLGRVSVHDVFGQNGELIVSNNQEISDVIAARLDAEGIEELEIRSVLTCETKRGICGACYGRNLATGRMVQRGEAVGVIAAQSIGEPGTQLTMRTFHTGGAASDGGDITHGLPRVVELFEARTPKGVSPISAATGRVRIDESDKAKKVIVIPDDGSEELEYPVSKRAKLVVEDGQTVTAGDLILVGKPDPKEVLRIRGPRQVQIHLTDEVQEVYRSQGVSIHDKHIEVIVRQMLKRVIIVEQAESTFLTGELVERSAYENDNRRLVAEGGKPASARPELMGITKASLATESWLSAASFQETTRVLTDAAINGKRDPLLGLKENVIIGKLIPAGTGLPRYRNVKVEPTEEAKAAVYAAMSVYDDYDYGDFGQASGEAVRLEDYDMGQYRS
jgi:DNA-directed RNA polymerase subunit beta'